MDRPDRIRNSRVFLERLAISPWEPTTNTISQENPSTTMVRRAVARVELTCSIPIFANIAVIRRKMPNQTRTRPKSSSIPRFPRTESSLVLYHTPLRRETQESPGRRLIAALAKAALQRPSTTERPPSPAGRGRTAPQRKPAAAVRERAGSRQVQAPGRTCPWGSWKRLRVSPGRETLLLCDGREKIPPPPKGEQGVGTDPAVPAELAGAAPGNLGQVQGGGALCFVFYGGVLLFSVLPPGGEWHFLPSPPTGALPAQDLPSRSL